ncbi:MAG: FKBP-type peptidyl-prolyl cis-trans isomerase [Polyangiaceae bacterium]|nr:FKBP-type peptidyl-prolyl cis-trans isomerase [Polyangiaceae bacterium]
MKRILVLSAVMFACDNSPKPVVNGASTNATASAVAPATASSAVETAHSAIVESPAPVSTIDAGDLSAPKDVAAPPPDAQKSASGLASKVIVKGKGKDHPSEFDTVKVHYSGWTKDGKLFDSSLSRGEPTEFPLNGVIKGWTEGVQLMVEGEKRRFWIPAKLAYGEKPAMVGAPSGDLTFDVELLSFKKAPKPPAVPTDVAALPATAKKTASGLGYRVLKAGTGKVHPKPENKVTVHYTGWTTDGKMFDSSVTRGEPTSFPLGNVIKGWTEGLQLMVEGESTRFWIPANLAYGDSPRPGAPKGMLVFDVELLSIH